MGQLSSLAFSSWLSAFRLSFFTRWSGDDIGPDFFDVIVSVVSCFASWAPPSQNQTKQREREHILFQSTIA